MSKVCIRLDMNERSRARLRYWHYTPVLVQQRRNPPFIYCRLVDSAAWDDRRRHQSRYQNCWRSQVLAALALILAVLPPNAARQASGAITGDRMY